MPYKKITCPTCKGKKTFQNFRGKELDCDTCGGLGFVLVPLQCGFRQFIKSSGSMGIPDAKPDCVEDNCVFWDIKKLDCNFNIITKLLSGQIYDQIAPSVGNEL